MSDSIQYGKAAYGNLDELASHGTKLDAATQELRDAFRSLYPVFAGQGAAAVAEVEAAVQLNLQDWIARHSQQTQNAVDQHDAMHSQDNAVRDAVSGSYGGGRGL
ncbi:MULTISPECIES: hypothetical protein [Mycobacteriaceae]|uniref:Uncharacterized protein n=1 Tax=Mycobacteroides salmoniphilum TaxID=404941 RepID=A0A4R8T0C1_9MYCO|nr:MULTISPECIES: hypothetical protein [Mycobacteriaceae]TEA08731.1 hypothetical protein CCUG60884_01226 [Mycobacteroides salmoniphilum]